MKGMELESNNAKHAFQCAMCHERLGEIEDAKKYYLTALAFDHENRIYHANYADFLCNNTNNFDDTRSYFENTIKLMPDKGWPYQQYAKALRNYAKDYEEAEKYCLKALEIGDKNELIHGTYGYLLYLMGEYNKAIEHLEIELEADDRNYLTHYYHALANHSIGNEEKAEKSLSNAVGLVKINYGKIEILRYMKLIQKNDPRNSEYHERFVRLLEEKEYSS